MSRRVFEAQYESMSRDELVELQWRKFRQLLRNAFERNPFYRRKFTAIDFRPEDIKTPADLPRVPMTTKDELLRDIEEHPPYGSRLAVQPREIVSVVETSGTSGRGREVHPRAAGDLERVFRVHSYGFVWVGIEKGTVVMLTWPIGMTPASTSWFYALTRLQANVLRAGLLSTEEKLRYLRRYGVEALVVTPSYLTRLEQMAEEAGLDIRKEFPTLKAIVVSGEGRSAKWAHDVEARWGAKLYEHWGCTQGGHAWTCEHGMLRQGQLGLMHTFPHLVLLEVINPETQRRASNGEEGEVIVTPLDMEATVLIRFATNDKAVYLDSNACPCGRPFDGLQCGSVARYDEMLKVKGVNIWPSGIAGLLEAYPEIREHRGEVYLDDHGREIAAVDVEFAPGCPPDARTAVRSRLEGELGAAFGISFVVREWTAPAPLESVIMNRTTGKPRRWTDRRGTSLASVPT